MTDELIIRVEGKVGRISLNRPKAIHSLTLPMVHGMVEALTNWANDPAITAVIVDHAEGRGFCAGGDVKGMAAAGDGTVGALTIDEAIHLQRSNQRATAGKLFKMPKPTLAALPGPAAGAGLSLALACDMRVMASSAIMTTAFARVGFAAAAETAKVSSRKR